jgi:arylsulfatase A-like enzyme
MKEESMSDAAWRPNLLFVFGDQWRAQAAGYAGDPNVRTPNLDRFARESVHFTMAVSGCPVCSPMRASLITGRYPLRHGVFLNDLCLNREAVSIADAFNGAGYDTTYIGKWHLDGHGRSAFIPPERRQGFKFWQAMECNHDYQNAYYYADNDRKLRWEGYEPRAQTREAQRYLTERKGDRPFALFLSWGPPHDPYPTAPEEYRRLYDPARLSLRPNVPAAVAEAARKDLAGYCAHVTALDDCFGELLRTVETCGLAENTLVIFTSDHGDQLGSHGGFHKQQPYDESVRVPFLMRCPARAGVRRQEVDAPFNSPDIMPTLLGLCGAPIPATVEGTDFSPYLRGAEHVPAEAALITCPSVFGEWQRADGGREYRGVRTRRHTFVRDLSGPWLLFDNVADPFQMENLCNRPEHAALQRQLNEMLEQQLRATQDEFLPGAAYVRRWGYHTDRDGSIAYSP